VARRHGMLLSDYLSRVSRLEHEVQVAFDEIDWEEPDKHDQYLMMIAMMQTTERDIMKFKSPLRLVRTLADGQAEVPAERPKPMTKTQIRASKAMWGVPADVLKKEYGPLKDM
jgi:hypothetical protein